MDEESVLRQAPVHSCSIAMVSRMKTWSDYNLQFLRLTDLHTHGQLLINDHDANLDWRASGQHLNNC